MADSFFESTINAPGATFGAFSIPAGALLGTQLSANADIARTQLVTDSLKFHEIHLADWRVHDSMQPLPATGSSDDLGWYPGTFGTDPPLIRTQDVKTLTGTGYIRTAYTLPHNYVSGGLIRFRAYAGMKTTVAGTSCTIDAAAHLVGNLNANVGADLVTTSAQSMNSLTAASFDFVITPTGLVGGNTLDIRVAVAYVDAATGTAVIAAIGRTGCLLDVKG